MRKITIFSFILSSFYVFSQKQDLKYYNQYIGTYQTKLGKELVIGKSPVRLFLYDPQTTDYRGLYQQSDSTWVSYNSLLKRDSLEIEKTIQFSSDNSTTKMVVLERGKTYEAIKSSAYKETRVECRSSGLNLRGSLLLPNRRTKVPAVIMVHGSGEQDRNGYASYIRLIADHLAKSGIAVLIYDKRGSGESEGNWRSASFEDLAEDALSWYGLLKKYDPIDANQIGFGGSSQAGWILAKAIETRPEIPFVFCISGAGMGIAAAKQNIYNNITELKNLGANKETLSNARESWNLLYDYIKSTNKDYAKKLDENLQIVTNTDYLNHFPPPSNTFTIEKKEFWFQTLEVNYDPISAWQNYNGEIYAVFGELDASTPVDQVLKYLRPIIDNPKKMHSELIVYPKASHLILEASKKSDSEFGELTRFHSYFLSNLSNWILRTAGYQKGAVTEVITLEKKWLESYENRDVDQMKRILDDDFKITFPSGYIEDKEKIVSNLSANSYSCLRKKLYTTKTSAVVYDDVVVLRGVVTTECNQEADTTFQRQRYTDTYLRHNGKWRVITSHLSNYE